MFKVGQRVVCEVYGEGEVTDVKDEYTYGIEVSFKMLSGLIIQTTASYGLPMPNQVCL